MRRRFFLVENPGAGVAGSPLVEDVARLLAKAGAEVTRTRGAGFDARVVGALDQRLKSRLGKAAYAGPLLGAIIRPIDTLIVTVDGRRHGATWAVIANARHYGGHFVLAPRTGILERGLEAIL